MLTRRLMPVGQRDIPLLHKRPTLRRLISDADSLPLDDALITWFEAPHSFTGDEVVEISCHGSPVVLAEVMRLLCRAGADPAEPGEFSMRAFLNGRMDLAQAEAVNSLIHSRTAYQARVAARQLRGELSARVRPLRQSLIDLIVHFESTVEFVEDDLDPLDLAMLAGRIESLAAEVARLADGYRVGRVVSEGVKLALTGLPNVGKSSLFNALLGQDRAIVTHIPGTTRDTLSEIVSIGGLPVSLIDTAGIRQSDDLVESLGVERTRSAMADADLLIAVVEAPSQLPDEELRLLQDHPIDLFVVSKRDLGPPARLTELADLAGSRPVIELSAVTGDGIGRLREEIHRAIVGRGPDIDESSLVTNERHYRALCETHDYLRRAIGDLRSGFTEEVALNNLHLALRSLGLITGETLIGEIINRIFATFCIGK